MTAVAYPMAYQEEFGAFAKDEGDASPSWATDMRRAAFERFEQLGFPTPRDEDWHFTSVAQITEQDFRLAQPSSSVSDERLTPFRFGDGDWCTIVFVNGRFAPDLSRAGALPSGARVVDLATAWREDGTLLERHLGRVTSFDSAAFTALNTAFMYDGAFIHIAKNVNVALPIHIVYVADGTTAKSMQHPRNLIVADANAKATVIESYVSLGSATYFTNAVTEVVVADGATLSHLKLQRESERAFHVGTVEATQGRDSHFVSFSYAEGAALSRTNIYTTLAGAGCGATLNGLYMVDGEQHVDHQTQIVHAEPNCFSREVYKGILDGASHGVFNGKVYVHPVAQKTDGKQSNNNLLLSERARIDTKPQLEIFADDVKCTHGATIGRLDELALFYMKSRGISAENARRLLTYAFAADVLETIEVTEVREELERATLARFTEE
ncbi:MAG: Fe-S cluster assembly protein SufD [Gemmatimonadaceae bacterium]